MKKKKKGTGLLIIILLFLVVLGGAVVFFGFINDPTAISIRKFIAGKYVEKGNDDKAEDLYYDILSRNETDAEAYLALGDIYIRANDYEEAHDILGEGLEYAPCEDIADKKWSVYEKEAKLIEAEGVGKELLDFVNDIPAEELREYYEDQSRADKYARDDAKRWTDSILALAKQHTDHGDYSGAATILEDAADSPLNEFVDIGALNEYMIVVYLKLGNEALANGDKDKNGKYFFGKVLALDPSNKEALEGLSKLEAMDDDAQKWKKITINAVVKSELGVNMHGLKLTVPVTVTADAKYDGTTPGAEEFTVDENISLSILGQKQEQSQSIRVYQDRKDMVIESGITGTQREPDTSLKDTIFEFISDYHAIISTSPVEGEKTVNGIKCNVSHATMKGKDYLYYIPKEMLSGGTDELLKSITLDVTRYTAVDDGRVVRIEAEMLNVDSDALNQLLGAYLGGLNADVTMNSLNAVIDVDCK